MTTNENERHYYTIIGSQFEYHTNDFENAEKVFNEYAPKCEYLAIQKVIEDSTGCCYSKPIKVKCHYYEVDD